MAAMAVALLVPHLIKPCVMSQRWQHSEAPIIAAWPKVAHSSQFKLLSSVLIYFNGNTTVACQALGWGRSGDFIGMSRSPTTEGLGCAPQLGWQRWTSTNTRLLPMADVEHNEDQNVIMLLQTIAPH